MADALLKVVGRLDPPVDQVLDCGPGLPRQLEVDVGHHLASDGEHEDALAEVLRGKIN